MHWNNLKRAGLVRVLWVVDDDYDIANLEGDIYNADVHTDIAPEQLERERTEFHETINRDGVWGLQGQYRIAGEWHNADAVWGFVGQDACGYEADIQDGTMLALAEALKKRCPKCRLTT